MLDSFKMSISLDAARDAVTENDKIVSKLLENPRLLQSKCLFICTNMFIE